MPFMDGIYRYLASYVVLLSLFVYDRCTQMVTKEKNGSVKVQIEMKLKPKQEKQAQKKKTNQTLTTPFSSSLTTTDLLSKPSIETSIDPEPVEGQESQEGEAKDENIQKQDSEREMEIVGDVHTPGYSSEDSQVKVEEESKIDIEQQSTQSSESTEQELKQPPTLGRSSPAEDGDSSQAVSPEQDKDKSSKGIVSKIKSAGYETAAALSSLYRGVKSHIIPSLPSSWKKKEQKLKPTVIKREKRVKLTEQSEEDNMPTENVAVLMSVVIPFKDIRDCSLSVHLSGKNCKSEDVGLFVRYT